MRPHHVPPEAKAAAERKGAIAFANTLVDCEPKFQPVFDALLGRILIVESLQIALQLAKTNGWSRLVTLEGEVVHSGGAVTGGNGARISYGVVQRKADLESIEEELAEISASVRKAEQESANESSQIEEIEAQIAELKSVLETQKAESAEANQWAAQVHHELLATRKEIEKLERESAALQSQDSTSTEVVDLQSLEKARDRALHAFAALSADAEVASARIHEADSRRKIAAERMAGSQRKLAALEEAEGHRIRKTGNLGPERERALQEIEAAKKSQIEADANRIEVEAKLASGSDQKRQLLEKSFELSEQAKAARANSQVVSDALHQAELNRARMESKLAAALQRLIEEYGITEEAALEMQPPTDIPSDASQLVSRLRREIRSMGDVNVGAIEAYERMTSRHTELTEQTKDIEAGISDVEAGIKELDNLTRGRFEETFSSVQEAFEEIFVRLFPEGNGQLQLSNPSNLLESGIEIDVQLPGKKKQRLELLSGGERSLCATAFLFALLKVKPSPLVVLDEVDAPLDGRNVERFIELLRDFSKEIQFIVITHNTSTIAAAPVWLGVTMSEPGVSTLVPVRIPDSSRQAALL
jgi:chromosome segregation protein